jgi:hypothetical protein
METILNEVETSLTVQNVDDDDDSFVIRRYYNNQYSLSDVNVS